jgi:transposase
MTIEEELMYLREENRVLREQLAQRDALIQQQQALLFEQKALIQHQGEQMGSLSQQMKALQDRLAKESHNSHLPPSSDRLVRKPKSLRTKSEKPSDGQPGHQGSSLPFSSTLDEIIEQPVDRCEACQHDLHAMAACGRARRQVVDLPWPRLLVREYRAEQKHCPHCHHITIATFPAGVQAPIQYGPQVGATAMYLVEQQLLPLAPIHLT